MKAINILSVLILLNLSFPALGQEQEVKNIKKISIHDIYIQSGHFSESNTTGTLEDFKTLAPQSLILNNDMTDFRQYNSLMLTDNKVFSVMLGLKFTDQQKSISKGNPILRMGVSYFSGTSYTSGLYREDRKRHDTLTSAQTGQTIYVDSLHEQYYNMNYRTEQIRFDASMIFMSDPKARWTVFAGVGFTAGVSVKTNTDIEYLKLSSTEMRDPSGNIYYSHHSRREYNNISERYSNESNWGVSAYIPLGIDFRMGKKRQFWKQVHLFYELRPLINVTSIPELLTNTNGTAQHGLGLRFSWN